MFYTYNENCCDGNSCVHEYCEDKKKVYLQKKMQKCSVNKFLSSPSIHVLSLDRKVPSNFLVEYTALLTVYAHYVVKTY